VFDLIKMYRYKFAEKIVGEDWTRFCEKYYQFEDDVYHNTTLQSDFDAFPKPSDEKLVEGLTISHLMKVSDGMGDGRNAMELHIPILLREKRPFWMSWLA